MSQDYVAELLHQVMTVLAIVAGPFLAVAVFVGVCIGILQAATQIQESTLSLVPKLAILGIAMVLGGPWILERLVQFTAAIFREVAALAPQGIL
jgi:flagellar biosynthetic protein FliQ